jgi:phosphoribosyl-dephospho-CoA transferase
MFQCGSHSVRTHDLLEIDARQFLSAHAFVPEWAEQSLRGVPFVVVRRGLCTERNIPIGVRGVERNQRWAALCPSKGVKRVITPSQLLGREVTEVRADAVPALRSLELLEARWMKLDHAWGPSGSVGFELATGTPAAKQKSDLDIVIHAEKRMTTEEAMFLCESAKGLPAVIDIRVETPFCGFALQEYAHQALAPILLRTLSGFMFGSDPWDDSGLPDTVCDAASSRTI